MSGQVWTGGFVADRLGVRIHTDPHSPVAIEDLVGLALRRNPKRAHLLVSRVLAKHVPTEPALVMAAGHLLGAFVAHEIHALKHDAGTHPGQPTPPAAGLTRAADALSAVLRENPGERGVVISLLNEVVAELEVRVPGAVVIGYAETATGLGRLVANALGAYYIHSTRHATPEVPPVAGFEEGHSHATSHAMVPTDPRWLSGAGPVVLVDDEFSTGSTVINTIRELHALVPHEAYIVAALIDLRSNADKARFEALAHELDTHIVVTALGTGNIELGPDILADAGHLISALPFDPPQAANAPGRLSMLELADADIVPIRSDRFGNAAPPSSETITTVATRLADLLQQIACRGPYIILGCEENMYLPLAVAAQLQELLPDADVRFSTTTRSPIVPLDRPDYAVAASLTFASHDATLDGPGVRFTHNLNGAGQRPGTIVAFPEPGTVPEAVTHSSVPHLAPMTAALRTGADDVVVVLLPAAHTTRQPAEESP